MLQSSINSVSDKISQFKEDIRQESLKLSGLEGQRDMVVEQRKMLEASITDTQDLIDIFKLIEAYLAAFADERQAQVYKNLENTVTEGLRAVFGEDLRLEVTNKMVGSRSETVFSLVSPGDGEELRTSILDSRGGGVAAIIGFLVQAVLVLLTPGLRPIVFLDESFKNVSEDYQAPLGEFIQDLCAKTGLQVVLVTHQPAIGEYADRWYSFSQVKGETKIKKVI